MTVVDLTLGLRYPWLHNAAKHCFDSKCFPALLNFKHRGSAGFHCHLNLPRMKFGFCSPMS